jgi:hypothetical protein
VIEKIIATGGGAPRPAPAAGRARGSGRLNPTSPIEDRPERA